MFVSLDTLVDGKRYEHKNIKFYLINNVSGSSNNDHHVLRADL
jgi:hypothetical protein